LSDGRVIGVAISREQREACRIGSRGLHWDALNEDISVGGLHAGFGDHSRPLSSAAE
jgi:hypothetical protein